MKNTLTLLILLISCSVEIFGCCGETTYRLFPIGEIDQKLVFIEFNLSRNCRKGVGVGDQNEFWLNGTINLMTTAKESLVLLENIDTVKFKECNCTYKDFYKKSEYETLLGKYYQKAISKAKEHSNFLIAETGSIEFNDTLNTQIEKEFTDSTVSYLVEYEDLLKVDLGLEHISSCYPDKVSEIRNYKTANFTITVFRLRCRLIDKKAVNRNKKRFRKLETAFWKEQAQWHGLAKDYYVIKRLN